MPLRQRVRHLSLLLVLLSVFPVSAGAQSPTDPITPGTSRTYSTMYSIGIEWDVTGDSDHDAVATVEFKVQGSATWKPALPLVRTDRNGINRLAGSILFLAPDTPYDVRVSLFDPDGGGTTRSGVVRTRRVPAAPTGRMLQVVPGSGGGDGSFAAPFRGIAAAQAAALPGDTLVLHAGSYSGATGGAVVFDKPGTSAAYIAWKAAGDGEVLMNGVNVAASHLWLEGITIRNIQGRSQALVSVNSPTNVVVTRCNFVGNLHSIVLMGAGTNWYIVDNTIVGTTPAGTTGSASFTGEGVDLGVTSGHTVAYNSITNVADGISQPHTNVDIFANDIFDTADDGIEADKGQANVRIWGNRIHNAVHNGISFQPQVTGPWYIIRNQIVSNEEAAFKFREDATGAALTDRFVLLHNTIVNWGRAYPGFSMMCCNEYHLMFSVSRNNLWISVHGGEIWGFESHTRDWRADLDYDGFDWGTGAVADPFTYAGVSHPNLASFSIASGLEVNGVRIDHTTCFEDFRVLGPSPQSVPPHRMTLQAGCPAVDAGAVLPNINEGFVGAAPDMGAYERGAAAVAFGPRPRGTAVPAAPTALQAAAANGAIGIQWTDNANNEDGFRIERSTDGTTFNALVSLGPGSIAYNDGTVSPGVQYYYRVAAYNEAGPSSYSNVASATVTGSGATEIVLWAAKAPTIVGQWQVVNDTTAAGGKRLQNPNAGAARVDTPLASPPSYFELTFSAETGRAYRLWMRGKATGDSWSNDSVWAQFDKSVNAQGTAVYRIGSTSATRLALQPVDGATLSGWGWEDNGFNGTGPSIYFSTTGTQRLRIQVREDGLGIDQIVLSASTYFNTAPGAPKNDNTILPESGGPPPPTAGQEVVLWVAKAPTVVGQWQVVSDTTAAGGQRLQNPDAGAARVDTPLAAPASYFELTFTAQAGRAYRLWMRGKAIGDSWLNDSVWAQFDKSVNAQGTAVYRIGSTSATRLALQPVDGATLSGWGWEDNGFNGTGPSIYFSTTGTQRLRIQVREDGLGIDQIVLSAATYFNTAPGAAKNDTTILPENSGLAGGGDRVTFNNRNGAGEIGILVDGTIGGTAVNDRAYTTAAAGDVTPGNIAPVAHNEVIAFQQERPVALVEGAAWTTGNDTITVPFANEMGARFFVWLVQGPFVDRQTQAVAAGIKLDEIWRNERMGMNVTTFQINDATTDPDSTDFVDFTCADAADLVTRIGHDGSGVNLYYVNRVDFGSGFATGNGVWCGANIVVMGSNASDHLAAHEVGHAFQLDHVNHLTTNFDTTNVMHNASNNREFFTEGQTFRAHLHPSSVINTTFGLRPGLPTRNCGSLSETPTDTCPAIQRRIWADGAFPPG